MTLDDVDAFAMSLAGVTVSARRGHRTWMVGTKFFAWQRPFSKANLARFGDQRPPAGDILAVKVESLDAKDAMLAMAPPGFFTIPHFNGFAAVLIELNKARARDVRAVIVEAYRTVSAAATKRGARKASRPARRRAKHQ